MRACVQAAIMLNVHNTARQEMPQVPLGRVYQQGCMQHSLGGVPAPTGVVWPGLFSTTPAGNCTVKPLLPGETLGATLVLQSRHASTAGLRVERSALECGLG
jgi:hypothetical protein